MVSNIISKRELKIFFTFFVIYAIFINWPGMRETSIFSLTKAIANEGRFEIDTYHNQTSDRSFFKGHYYSDKEPGLSFLAAPVYSTWKFIYYNLFPKDFIQSNQGSPEYDTKTIRSSQIIYYYNPGFFELSSLFIVVLFTSSLFSSLAVVLVYKFSRFWTDKERDRLILTAIYGIGSLAFHYGLVFMGHGGGAFFIFLSFYLIYLYTKQKNKNPHFILAGILAGFSVSLDFLSLIIVALLYIYVLAKRKYKESFCFLFGAFIGLLPFLLYNFMVFGNPFDLPRNHLDPDIWSGLPGKNGVIIDIPYNLHVALRLLFFPYRGLFIYFPVLFFSFYGLYLMRRKLPLETILIFLIFVLVLFAASTWWAWWHGSSFGPRLLTVAMPFIVLPITYVLKKKYFLPLVIILLFISALNNFAGVTDSYEDALQSSSSPFMPEIIKKKFENFEVLGNPLHDYYYPSFFNCGPRSKLLDALVESKSIDVRASAPTRCPILFLSTAFLLVAMVFLWFNEIMKKLKFRILFKSESLKELKKIHWHDKFLLFLIISFLFFFLNFLYLSFTVLFYPYDLDVTESYVIIPAIRLLHGGPLYNDIRTPLQFSVVKHPPLFYILNYFSMIIFGETLFSARILVFLASLISGAFIFLIVKKITNDTKISLLPMLIFFSSYVTFQMATQARVDMIALLFSLAGVYFLLSYKKHKNLILSVFFFILAIFTNQTFLAAPISAFLYLILRDKKIGVKFLILFLIPSIVIIILINFLTNGQFLLHTFHYSRGLIDFSLMTVFFSLRESLIFLIIALFYFLRKRKDFLFFWIFFALIILLIKLSREGSWINYLLEVTAVVSILVGVLLKQTKDKIDFYFILILVSIQIIISLSYDARIFSYILNPNTSVPLANLLSDQKIQSYVNSSIGNVLIEHAGYSLISKKQPSPELWSAYELEKMGVISTDEAYNYFESQNYSTVIYFKRLPLITNVLTYVERNYKLVDRIPWVDQAFHEEVWHVYKK